MGLFGWLVLILIVLVIVYVVRSIMGSHGTR